MIIWGSSGKAVDAGDAGSHYCEVCKEQRSFRYMLTYKVHHIWYLLRWPTSQKYFRTCQVCNNSFDSTAPVAVSAGIDDGVKTKHPIPFFDRWGWAVGLGVLSAFIGMVMITANIEKAADAKLVADPKAGDRYIVKIEKFVGEVNGNSPLDTNYGIVRVASINGDVVVFDLPRMVWTKSSKLRSEIYQQALQNTYYEGGIQIPKSALGQLEQQGVIEDVER